ncbi:MAG: Obg family GTPase CgtA [Actinobacteria bacterium]|nr:Obg family GTPase CgtA [Actinomycetota bacterium]
MFVDEINLSVSSGAGGPGSVSFNNLNSKTKPSGGSGGHGGSVYLSVNKNLNDLSHIMSNSSLKAQNGGPGNKNFQNGTDGKDLFLEVPKGTQVFVHNEMYADLHDNDSSYELIIGSRGGRGNYELVSSRNPNPKICEQGEKRKSIDIKLKFSIYSDISIVGMPNAGKSTLIQKLTNSKAKIGDYEFTTTSPNIGVLNNLESQITICDLPGLIKGASDGVGMGRKVLKHLRNTKFIIFLLDPTNEKFNIEEQISMLTNELNGYDKNYNSIENIKVINKSDLVQTFDSDLLYVSCFKNEGIDNLVKLLQKALLKDVPRIYSEYHKIFLQKEDYSIEKMENQYICTGDMVSNMVNISGNNDSVLDEIFFRFEKSPLSKEIEEMGASDGDIVVLGNLEFEYQK